MDKEYDTAREDKEQVVKTDNLPCDAYPRHLISGLKESMLCRLSEFDLTNVRITPTARMYRE